MYDVWVYEEAMKYCVHEVAMKYYVLDGVLFEDTNKSLKIDL